MDTPMKTKDGYVIAYDDDFEWEDNPPFPPGWRAYPAVYDTYEQAASSAATEMVDLWGQVARGEREYEDNRLTPPAIISVTVHEDGYMSTEDGGWSPADIRNIALNGFREG